MAYSAIITDCSSSCSLNGRAAVGGFAGDVEGEGSGTITHCSASGNVTLSSTYGGGFAGRMDNATISQSYAVGNVVASSVGGGFIGVVGGIISDCYARGNVTSDSWGAGFADYIQGGASLTNCYSTGYVIGSVGSTGGFSSDNSGTLTSCFWDTETSGQAASAGGTGKTTAEMKEILTFSAWNIATTTTERNDGYPFLNWEIGGSTPIWYIEVEPPPIAGERTKDVVALEAMRNIEMSAMGRLGVDKEGNLTYESRYARSL